MLAEQEAPKQGFLRRLWLDLLCSKHVGSGSHISVLTLLVCGAQVLFCTEDPSNQRLVSINVLAGAGRAGGAEAGVPRELLRVQWRLHRRHAGLYPECAVVPRRARI